MTYQEMEAVIIDTGLMLQTVLQAAFVIEECETIGGNSCFSEGNGRQTDPTHMIDRAISITKHIRDGETERLRQWIKTDHVDPRSWPRFVLWFWRRVPHRAAWDMARVAHTVV